MVRFDEFCLGRKCPNPRNREPSFLLAGFSMTSGCCNWYLRADFRGRPSVSTPFLLVGALNEPLRNPMSWRDSDGG